MWRFILQKPVFIAKKYYKLKILKNQFDNPLKTIKIINEDIFKLGVKPFSAWILLIQAVLIILKINLTII